MKNVKNPALFSAAVLAYVAKAAPGGSYSYSSSQWGQSECQGYYEEHGFQKEYASSCKSYYSEQYSGSWSSGDCEVLSSCWSGDELKKMYPDYYSKCSSYGGSFSGGKDVYYESSKYGSGQWGESKCKVYFDQYGFQKEYATACKEWYGKQWSGSCTEQECKVLYECWNGDELKVSYPDYYSKCSSYGGGYTKEVYYESSKYGGGQWGEAECKVYFDQYGFQKEYATACKEWYGKQWSGSCTEQECKVLYECWNGDELKLSYPDYFTKCSSYGGGYTKEVYYENSYGSNQWGESDCKAYCDQYGFTKEYATSCKSYYAEQYKGSWSDVECKVLYECWNGDELKKSYPDYDSKCKVYQAGYEGSGRVDKWDDNKCKAVWDEHYQKPAYLARRQGVTTTVTDIVTVPTTAPTTAPTQTVTVTVPTTAPTSLSTTVVISTSSGVTVTVTSTVTGTTKGPWPTDYPVIPVYPCDTCEKGKGEIIYGGKGEIVYGGKGDYGHGGKGDYGHGGKGDYGHGGKGEVVYGGKGGDNGYDGSWEEYTIYCKEYNDKYHGGYNGGWNGDYKGDKEYKGDNKGDYDYKGNGDNKGEYPTPPKVEYPKVEPPKAEYPKVEPPKAEYPKVEPPKSSAAVYPVPPKASDYPKADYPAGTTPPADKVDCKNPSYYHHKDCIVVVSGASSMFTVAGGLMTAALALGALL